MANQNIIIVSYIAIRKMAAQEEDEVYCLCRRPYDPSEFMIECDICNDWFHGRLVAGSPKRRVVFTRLFLINAHQGFDLVAEGGALLWEPYPATPSSSQP